MGFDVQLTQRPRGWELTDADSIFQAAKDLVGAEYAQRFRGSIQFWWENGQLKWLLDLHDSDQPKRPAKGGPGDVLLLVGNILQQLTVDQFAAIAQPMEEGS